MGRSAGPIARTDPGPAPSPPGPGRLGCSPDHWATLRVELDQVNVKLDQLLQAQAATALVVSTAVGPLHRLGAVLQAIDQAGPVGYTLAARKARRRARRPQIG